MLKAEGQPGKKKHAKSPLSSYSSVKRPMLKPRNHSNIYGFDVFMIQNRTDKTISNKILLLKWGRSLGKHDGVISRVSKRRSPARITYKAQF